MYKINKIEKESKRMHRIEKILNILLYSIIIPIIIFNFTLIIKSFSNPNETPDFWGYKNYIIISGSMEPTIMTGDAIVVKQVEQDEIKVNDIISFKQDGVITTHRIIGVIEENGVKKYKTKGDNNNVADKERVLYEQIEGKYQFKISHFGVMIEILQSKLTLIVLIVIIIANYLYSYRLEKKRQQRREKREKYDKQKRNETLAGIKEEQEEEVK